MGNKEIKLTETMWELLDVAGKHGWECIPETWGPDDEPCMTFSQSSPAGEDFSFSVGYKPDNQAESLLEGVQDYATSFDTDEHIQMWIEAKENGVAGVPSCLDLVYDADAIQEMLMQLSDAMNAIYWGWQNAIAEEDAGRVSSTDAGPAKDMVKPEMKTGSKIYDLICALLPDAPEGVSEIGPKRRKVWQENSVIHCVDDETAGKIELGLEYLFEAVGEPFHANPEYVPDDEKNLLNGKGHFVINCQRV